MRDKLTPEEVHANYVFWQAVCWALGPAWKVDDASLDRYMRPDESVYGFSADITDGDLTLHVFESEYLHPNTWRVSPVLPRNCKGHLETPFHTSIPEIFFSILRDEKSAANQISRRLLSRAKTIHSLVVERNQATKEYYQQRRDSLQMVAEFLGVPFPDENHSMGASEGRLYLGQAARPVPGVSMVEAAADGEVRFTITCKPELAIKIFQLL